MRRIGFDHTNDSQRLRDYDNVPESGPHKDAHVRRVLPGSLQRFAMATWNSNGLLGKDATKSRKKLKYLNRLLNNYDVVAVQELHGDELACKRLKDDYRHSHLVNYSVGPCQATAGIAFFTKHSISDKTIGIPALDIFEPGRAGTLTLTFGDGDIYISNIHHFDLNDQHAVVRRVTAYHRKARSSSSGCSVSILAGDFNFLPPGEKASRVGIDGASFPSVADSGFHAARGKVWAPA